MNNFYTNYCCCSPPLIQRCDGSCFKRHIHQYQSHYCHSIPFQTIRTCSPVLFSCNPTFKYSWYPPTHFDDHEIETKSLDPSSYQITVRPVTSSELIVSGGEADQIHEKAESSSQISILSQLNIPSVPSKKVVIINNGLQVSSTSFITPTEDPVMTTMTIDLSVMSFSKSLDYFIKDTSSIDSLTIDRNVDAVDIIDKRQIYKQTRATENGKTEEEISLNRYSIPNDVETFSKHFLEKQYSPINPSHRTVLNERRMSSPKSIMDEAHRPALPSSLPPNIDKIKSSEIFIKSSRSGKSISSTKTIRQSSNLSLRATRSTVDFGFIIDETTTI